MTLQLANKSCRVLKKNRMKAERRRVTEEEIFHFVESLESQLDPLRVPPEALRMKSLISRTVSASRRAGICWARVKVSGIFSFRLPLQS